MLMYGVPTPDGVIARPVDENGNPIKETEAKEFPDGRIAKPLTDEESQAALDAIHAEKEAMKSEQK